MGVEIYDQPSPWHWFIWPGKPPITHIFIREVYKIVENSKRFLPNDATVTIDSPARGRRIHMRVDDFLEKYK
jgi:hypothetical protein